MEESERISSLMQNVGHLRSELANKASEICRLARELEDSRQLNEEFRTERDALNQRLDQVLNVTQKDRVDFNLHKLEVDSFIKQIEALKVSDIKFKR